MPSSSPSNSLTSQPTCESHGYLGSACNYAILSKTGISTTTTAISDITGSIAVSPIDSAAMTGFTLTLDGSGEFSTSSQVTGKAFAADYATPTPAELSKAISDMDIAYANATARANTRGSFGAVPIGDQTFLPGVYFFTSALTIASDITFEGGPNDVFVMQIETALTQNANTRVLLAGCAQAKNIFWRVKTSTKIFENASMQGIILGATKVDMLAGSSLVGSFLTKTRVDLIEATITQLDTCSST
jgi:hypothetical protein